MSVRCAVVGVGYLGRFHAQKLAALPESRLVGVCDASEERARQVAAEVGTEAFTDPEALLGKVDAVVIAASTPAHFELCRLFLDNGVHVLVEKPMTLRSAEAEELCRLAERRERRLQVGHIERYNPALLAARAKLTRPMFVECHRLAPLTTRSNDVDVIRDLMIHDLDVILLLVRSEPVTISAVGSPVVTPHLDIANARVEFASGAVANVTASRVSIAAQRKFRVFQKDQYLSIDFQSGDVNLLTKTGPWDGTTVPFSRDASRMEKGDALMDQARDFLTSLSGSGGTPIGVSGRDAVASLRLAEAIVADAEARLARALQAD